MKKLLFFIFLAAFIGGAGYIVLFLEGFWTVSLDNNSDTAASILFGASGFDLLESFVRNISDSEVWGTTSAHFLIYGLALFVVFSAIALLLALIRLLIRSRTIYRSGMWFWFATWLISGAFIWTIIDFMSAADALGAETSWGVHTFSWWFFVPFMAGLVLTILGAIFRRSERR